VSAAGGLPPLRDWHDFFAIIGTASATLIGAMFVVVSIGIGFLTRDRATATRTFLTPTVTHLSTALFGALMTMVPALVWVWLGAITGLGSVAGLIYSVRVLFGFRQHAGTDHSDWMWYALFPPVGYALLLVTAATALRGAAISLDLLAAALIVLLIAGIRNAWDMILFLVTQARGSS
jgi:hypothetical protein